jgi:hypothetical protein
MMLGVSVPIATPINPILRASRILNNTLESASTIVQIATGLCLPVPTAIADALLFSRDRVSAIARTVVTAPAACEYWGPIHSPMKL